MQTKIQSIIEQISRITISYLLSCISYTFIFNESWKVVWFKGIYFVLLSFFVGYTVRRFFNIKGYGDVLADN